MMGFGTRCLFLLVPLFAISNFTAGAAALSIQELPRNPADSCAAGSVRAAFTRCAFGATAACCRGLDAVYANSSQPSYGCLCYPAVLYHTLAQASQSGVDVLRVLSTCRKQQQAFRTQWAAAADTECPELPLSTRAGDVLPLLGPAAALSGHSTGWAWRNILQFGDAQRLRDTHSVWDLLLGVRLLQAILLVIICLGPLFLLMHLVLTRCSRIYRGLAAAERLVVCQHSVYAVVFSLSVVPQTVLALSTLFKAWTGDYFASWELPVLAGLFLGSRAVLYLIEVGVRSVVKPSWLLIVHHQLFFLIIVMGFWRLNITVVGIGLVLDLFACHEAPQYVALVGYRLRWRPALTRAILLGACAWYVVTRLFQTVVLVYMIAGLARMPVVGTAPEFLVTVVLFGAFTFIQAYTLVIYKGMYRKLLAADYVLPASDASCVIDTTGRLNAASCDQSCRLG